jgi:putative transposase
MSNHVHVLAVPERENSLAQAFGRAHNDYARWLNVSREVTGHLWQNRYYSCPLDEDHRWAALRYVEMNPVRAGLVSAPEEWPWSSARAHLGLCGTGALDWQDWRTRWVADDWRETLVDRAADSAAVDRIREATRTGRPVGSDEFLEHVEAQCGRTLRPAKRGPKAPPPASDDVSQLNFEVV